MKRPTTFQNEKPSVIRCRLFQNFTHKTNAIPIKTTIYFFSLKKGGTWQLDSQIYEVYESEYPVEVLKIKTWQVFYGIACYTVKL